MLRLLLLAALVGTCIANSVDIKIIANESVPVSHLSSEELQRVFLVKTNALHDGSRVTPVLALGSEAHSVFIKQYLGKTDAALNIYYRSLVFSGKAFMPKQFTSDAEVVSYVSRTKGAIGYVSANANTAGVKAVTIR